MPHQEEVLTFPVELSIKAVGVVAEDFEEHVLDLARRHATSAELEPGRSRVSSRGRYQAVTLRVSLPDRDTMDALYRELGADERVRWAM